MLAKTVKPATAWREANSSRDNRNITVSTAEGRPATTRLQEICRRDLPKSYQKNSEKFERKMLKKSKFFLIDFSNYNCNRTIKGTMHAASPIVEAQ